MGDPKPPANGSVTRLGTKKTGSHLAKSAAPGLSLLNRLGPKGNVSIVTNNAQHPPKEEGKEIASR